jgi:transposase
LILKLTPHTQQLRSATGAIESSIVPSRQVFQQTVSKIMHYRRVATRYDKLAANYLAFIQLASIRPWLRVSEFIA